MGTSLRCGDESADIPAAEVCFWPRLDLASVWHLPLCASSFRFSSPACFCVLITEVVFSFFSGSDVFLFHPSIHPFHFARLAYDSPQPFLECDRHVHRCRLRMITCACVATEVLPAPQFFSDVAPVG